MHDESNQPQDESPGNRARQQMKALEARVREQESARGRR